MLKFFQILSLMLVAVLIVEVTLWAVWMKFSESFSLLSSVLLGYASLLSLIFFGDKVTWVKKTSSKIWQKLFTLWKTLVPTVIIFLGICVYSTIALNNYWEIIKFNTIIDVKGVKSTTELKNASLSVENIHTKEIHRPKFEGEGRIRFRQKEKDHIQLKIEFPKEVYTFEPFKIEDIPFRKVIHLQDGVKEKISKLPVSNNRKFGKINKSRIPETYFRSLNITSPKIDYDKSIVETHILFGLPGYSNLHIRKGFIFSYNPVLKIPNWTAYRLQKIVSDPFQFRRPPYTKDPNIPKSMQASHRDYIRSGFDRGNLAAGADMRFKGEGEYKEAYSMVVIAPQTPNLNRRVWFKIESYGREFIDEGIGIIAGPLFLSNSPDMYVEFFTISETAVAVPTHYFRILYRKIDDQLKVLAFIVPNTSSFSEKDTIETFLVSVDEIERVSGLDFFSELPDGIETKIESKVPTGLW